MSESAAEVLDGTLTRQAFISWVNHPVTKAILLVLGLELAYQFALHRGVKALGLVRESVDEELNALAAKVAGGG